MEINQVKFGEYSIGNSRPNAKGSEEKKEEEKVQVQNQTTSSADANDVLNAMNLVGSFNQVQVKRVATEEVNPTDHLSQDRIDDIEAMMGEFDSGVSSIAAMIAEEFGDSLSVDKVNELAAKIYAGE